MKSNEVKMESYLVFDSISILGVRLESGRKIEEM